ncbi:MAG: DUF4890 domain-containing protein [Bacteroidales bacterium]|nr:DUF4890 domain-containing protein [Bacteroidales bacterium]
MKKTIIITMAALMLGIVANAQGHRGSWQDRPQRERPDEATMIQERTDRMAEKYGLDEAQKAKLLELNKEYSFRMERPEDRQHERMRQKPALDEKKKLEFEARMKEMQSRREAYEEALKGILTEDQYKAYQKDQEHRKGRRR